MTTTTTTTTPAANPRLVPELREQALDGVRMLLAYLGQDPHRDGLADTPRRVVDALAEMTSAPGDPDRFMRVMFTDASRTDQMITLGPVEFSSLCEHHLLPFTGHATLAYIPGNGRIIGLSKLARLVEHHARQPQVQERLTGRIVDDLVRYLNPKGAGVHILAHHACMGVRGIAKPRARMATTALRGEFHTPATRAEFLAAARQV